MDLYHTGLRILVKGTTRILNAAEGKIKLSYCFPRDLSAFTTLIGSFIFFLVFAVSVILKSPNKIKANSTACYQYRFLCITVKLNTTLILASENCQFAASKK